jgi:hypothetical protein
MKRKSLIAVATGTAVAAAVTFAGVAPANAISRASCGKDYLQLFSSSTTCWANAGTASVALYGVVGYSSGNNAGDIHGPNISSYFGKYASTGWTVGTTISTVHIK